MSKSNQLRVDDLRAIWRLVGECRDLGDDRIAWRDRWVAGLSDLVDADIGLAGEMAGCHELMMHDLGVTFWWRPGTLDLATLMGHLAEFRSDPRYSPAMIEYFRRFREQDGLCLPRTGFIDDKAWYRSSDYRLIQEPFGADATLWCSRKIDGAPEGETTNVILLRTSGRRDFRPRELAIVHEAHATLAPLVGGALARYADPSPSHLSPRLRQVLDCLLQGDGDKQVAARLGLAPATINDYTKALYRHFGVRGRSELMARWIRRGWGHRPGPADPARPAGMTVIGSGYGASFYENHRFGAGPAGRP
ncbi:response regulator transcription factor [Tundrisphaera sp. TA3]|uniref:helix-turn-helix transcriptional regulator n=1 Tax=Tundrisphaera sp. TA3 TaxID=3435775 RepID=UPI003EBB1281